MPGSRSPTSGQEIHNVAFRRGALEFYVEFSEGEDGLDESRNIVGTGEVSIHCSQEIGAWIQKKLARPPNFRLEE